MSSYTALTISGDYSFPHVLHAVLFYIRNNANLDTWMLHVPLRGLEA